MGFIGTIGLIGFRGLGFRALWESVEITAMAVLKHVESQMSKIRLVLQLKVLVAHRGDLNDSVGVLGGTG